MKKRILQIVSRMNCGGIETWLMHVLRHIDRDRYQMDFLVHSEESADYDREILSLGSQIHRTLPIQDLWRYGRAMRRTLARIPRYDVAHAHGDLFCGFPLRCAEQAGIPIRIAHSHSNQRASYAKLRWPVKAVATVSKALIQRHATHGLAASEVAAETLYGSSWRMDPRWSLLPCGLDLSRTYPTERQRDLHNQFGIPDGTLVIGHVGRMSHEKNHVRILEIAEYLARTGLEFRVMLVGGGPLRSSIEAEITRRGLGAYVILAGVRDDVPLLFAGLFDVLLFPSKYEGLGLAIVESLAAGCPAVISDTIPEEADLVKSLITRLSLDASVGVWAETVVREARTARSLEARRGAHEIVRNSPFSIEKCVYDLTGLYDKGTRKPSVSTSLSGAA